MSKVTAKITREVRVEDNGKVKGGYVEVQIRYGRQWRKLYFSLEQDSRKGKRR